MMVQLIQITREELENGIAKQVKAIIDDLKKDFEPKTSVEFLSRQQVAKLLDVDLSTLWAWTKKGKLKAYSLEGGHRIYYKRSEVEASLIQIKHD